MQDIRIEPDLLNTTAEFAAMVLLVDDQAIIGEAVRRALSPEKNIDFHFCADAKQALSQAVQIKPTVILQDLVMPHTDGLTLVREYRANPATRDIPIIVLSTKEEPAIKSAAFAAGANDYLVKLPDAIELVARVRYHSRSYITLLQRDEAYKALRHSQQRLLETNLELQRLTSSDGLTGIANRRHFDEHLEIEWRRATREQSELSLLMIDVDYFKPYNDSFGHLQGDEVLRQVARVIRDTATRPADLSARYGGEEFGLVLPGTTAEGARQIGETLRQKIQALKIPHCMPDNNSVLTISVGAATVIPRVDEACEHLVELADHRLYEAKRLGKNRVAAGGRE
jgi:two-component system chemotaxis family response regulator WspR